MQKPSVGRGPQHRLDLVQVATQPAMEALPLVMEPESKFYADPVAVLDFQSLYPSMIIAYNLCFSTCLGRPMHSDGSQPPPRLGVTSFNLAPGTMEGAAHPDRFESCLHGATSIPDCERDDRSHTGCDRPSEDGWAPQDQGQGMPGGAP